MQKNKLISSRYNINAHPHRSTVFTTLVFLVTSVLLGSRSYTLGFSAALFFILLSARQDKKRFFLLSLLALVPILLGLTLLFKRDSSLGRLLIYKISFRIFKDHFPLGIGYNQFANIYREYQGDYFRQGPYTLKELLLADNTQHAFNDYLQLFIECGLAGVLIAITIASSIIFSIKRLIKTNQIADIRILLASVGIISISTAASFSHQFENPCVQLLFFLSFFILFSTAYNLPRLFTYLTFFFLCSFLLSGAVVYIKNYKRYENYKEANQLLQTGYINQSITEYERLYQYLNNDVTYLSYYAKVLAITGRYDKAISLLKQAISTDNSPIFYQQLAECYQNAQLYQQAEDCYNKSIFIVPNRFEPRFALFNLYKHTNQQSKAAKAGMDILQLPVKIPSGRITFIKQNVQMALSGFR